MNRSSKRGGLLQAIVLLTMCLGWAHSVRAEEAKPPKVHVDSIRRVFHNGEHNAFTDLCKYRGQYYLTFRSCPDGHGVHPTSSIIVLTSSDGQVWTKVHQFRVERRDTRDPHFLVFQGQAFRLHRHLVLRRRDTQIAGPERAPGLCRVDRRWQSTGTAP